MPGRTDSRIRLLVLLVVFVGRLACADRPGCLLAGPRPRAIGGGGGRADPVRIETPSQRGDVYDRSGTVLLATTVQRERLVAAPDQLSVDERRATVAELARLLELDEAATLALRDKLASDSRYLVIRHGLDRTMADRIRAGLAGGRLFALSLEPEPERVYPQAGGGKDTTLAAHLLGFVNRDGVGQYGIEQAYQDELGGVPAGDRRRSRPDRAGGPRARDGEPARAPGHGPATDHRRRASAPGGAGAPGGLDRGQGQARVGRGPRSVHRRDLRRGDLPLVRRQRLPGDRRDRSVAVHRSGRVQRLRAWVGVQDDDRHGGPRAGTVTPVDPDQGHRDAPPRRRARPRSTTPTARAWAGCRSRTASPTRATWSRPRSPSGSARRPASRRPSCTTCGFDWAMARRPGSTWPAKWPASSATRP